MFIDLDSAKGEWFDFRMSSLDPNTGETVWGPPIPGHRVQVRSWKPFLEEQMANRERVIEWKINPKTRQNEKHSNFKELTPEESKQQKDDAIDYAIMGLEGFKDKKTREPIQCTRENKIALMALDFFDRFIADCQMTIDSTRVEQEAAEAKN
jgi:hypothetical protein